jgi:hypothetical protein
VDISRAWESTIEDMKVLATESLSYYEMKKHKPQSDEEGSKLSHQRKQATLQWLQDPSYTNGNNLDSVRHDTSRTFRGKKEGVPERKIY